jgi:hypothetical protein
MYLAKSSIPAVKQKPGDYSAFCSSASSIMRPTRCTCAPSQRLSARSARELRSARKGERDTAHPVSLAVAHDNDNLPLMGLVMDD